MKTRWLSKFTCAILLWATAFRDTSVRADTPAFVLGNVLSTQPVSFAGTRGWQFRPRNINGILITQLGVFDDGGDGLVNSHEIGLWRDDPGNISGTLLASGTVPAGTEAPLVGGYRWISITPVLIPYVLDSYVVAAQYSLGDADDLVTARPPGTYPNFQFAPDMSPFLGGGRAAFGDSLRYPVGTWGCGEGCVPEIFWEPNLQYVVVPEPAAWLLLSPGLLYLLLRRGRSR